MNFTISSVGAGRAPRQRSRCGLQDLVGSPQLADLALKLGDPLLLCGRDAWALAAVDLGMLDPIAQRLGPNPELTGDTGDGAYALAALSNGLVDHAHGSLTHLGRVAALEGTIR